MVRRPCSFLPLLLAIGALHGPRTGRWCLPASGSLLAARRSLRLVDGPRTLFQLRRAVAFLAGLFCREGVMLVVAHPAALGPRPFFSRRHRLLEEYRPGTLSNYRTVGLLATPPAVVCLVDRRPPSLILLSEARRLAIPTIALGSPTWDLSLATYPVAVNVDSPAALATLTQLFLRLATVRRQRPSKPPFSNRLGNKACRTRNSGPAYRRFTDFGRRSGLRGSRVLSSRR